MPPFCHKKQLPRHIKYYSQLQLLLDLKKHAHNHTNRSCSTVDCGRCTCCVCISRDDDLIPLTDSTNTEIQFLRCCGRVQAYNLACVAVFSQSLFQFLRPWTCGDSATSHRFRYFIYFQFRNVRRTKNDNVKIGSTIFLFSPPIFSSCCI